MEPMEANVQTQPGKRLAEEPKRKKGGKRLESGDWDHRCRRRGILRAPAAYWQISAAPFSRILYQRCGGRWVDSRGSAGQTGSRNSPENMQKSTLVSRMPFPRRVGSRTLPLPLRNWDFSRKTVMNAWQKLLLSSSTEKDISPQALLI